jgi:hypothetical protein
VLLGVVGVAKGLLFVVPLVDGAAKGFCDPEVGVEVEGEPGLTFGRAGVTGLLAGATGAEAGGCGLRSVPG